MWLYVGWMIDLIGMFWLFQNLKGKNLTQTMNLKKIQISKLGQFIAENPRSNIWRSWDVYQMYAGTLTFKSFVPIVIDIDDKSQNLENAYKLTRACLQYVFAEKKLDNKDVQIIFSGKKGFHLEIKPKEMVDAQDYRDDIIIGTAKIVGEKINEEGFNIFWDSTILDVFHDFIRLTGSVNSWKSSEGNTFRRRVIPINVEEFLSLDLPELIQKATITNIYNN